MADEGKAREGKGPVLPARVEVRAPAGDAVTRAMTRMERVAVAGSVAALRHHAV